MGGAVGEAPCSLPTTTTRRRNDATAKEERREADWRVGVLAGHPSRRPDGRTRIESRRDRLEVAALRHRRRNWCSRRALKGHTGRDDQDESSSRCHGAGSSHCSLPPCVGRQLDVVRLHRLRSDARGRIGACSAGGGAAQQGGDSEGRSAVVRRRAPVDLARCPPTARREHEGHSVWRPPCRPFIVASLSTSKEATSEHGRRLRRGAWGRHGGTQPRRSERPVPVLWRKRMAHHRRRWEEHRADDSNGAGTGVLSSDSHLQHMWIRPPSRNRNPRNRIVHRRVIGRA
jgi:hypothetical protein